MTPNSSFFNQISHPKTVISLPDCFDSEIYPFLRHSMSTALPYIEIERLLLIRYGMVFGINTRKNEFDGNGCQFVLH